MLRFENVTKTFGANTAVHAASFVIETGLTDQALDDPQHAYTQLLVSSVLQV